MLNLREFRNSDYEAYNMIHNELYEEYKMSVEELRSEDQCIFHNNRIMKRYVVEEETTRVVAIGGFSHSVQRFDPKNFVISIEVHPKWQHRGIGSALHNRVISNLVALNAASVSTDVRDDFQSSIKFLVKRGYTEKSRKLESRLDVASFDFSFGQSTLKM